MFDHNDLFSCRHSGLSTHSFHFLRLFVLQVIIIQFIAFRKIQHLESTVHPKAFGSSELIFQRNLIDGCNSVFEETRHPRHQTIKIEMKNRTGFGRVFFLHDNVSFSTFPHPLIQKTGIKRLLIRISFRKFRMIITIQINQIRISTDNGTKFTALGIEKQGAHSSVLRHQMGQFIIALLRISELTRS